MDEKKEAPSLVAALIKFRYQTEAFACNAVKEITLSHQAYQQLIWETAGTKGLYELTQNAEKNTFMGIRIKVE